MSRANPATTWNDDWPASSAGAGVAARVVHPERPARCRDRPSRRATYAVQPPVAEHATPAFPRSPAARRERLGTSPPGERYGHRAAGVLGTSAATAADAGRRDWR